MASIILNMLLANYLADNRRFSQAVSVLALDLYNHSQATPAIKEMCDMLIMGNTATKHAVLDSLEEHYQWAR